jgi:hypothetical protein
MGFMKGEKIVGDIVSPASDPDDWKVLRDWEFKRPERRLRHLITQVH